MKRNTICFAVLLAFSAFVAACQSASLRVDGLKCEYRVNPLGLDTPQPRLSWRLDSEERGQCQTAYQILAATNPNALAKGKGDLWDSGKVASADSIHVVYGGQPLRPGQRVYWKVRAWDRDGRPSAYSAGGVVGNGFAGAGRLARGLDHPEADRSRFQSSRCSRTTQRRCSGRSSRSRRRSAAPGFMSAGLAITS